MSVDRSMIIPAKVIFAHGFEGQPNGRKAIYLREALGMEVISPTLYSKGWAFSDHVSVVSDAIDAHPDVRFLVGSSMGGLASAVALSKRPPDLYKLVLMAPAFGIHRSLRNRLGEDAFSQWSSTGTLKYKHAAVSEPIDLPFVFWTECREAASTTIHNQTVIIHGHHDTVIPICESRALAERSPGVCTLLEANDSHRLTDSLPLLKDALGILQGQAAIE